MLDDLVDSVRGGGFNVACEIWVARRRRAKAASQRLPVFPTPLAAQLRARSGCGCKIKRELISWLEL